MGQEWSPVWRREVKGFTFLGAQWRTVEPPIEEFVAKEAPTLDPDKPFLAPLSNELEGRNVGGDFELVEVFADRLVVHRLAVAFDEPVGPAWVVPLPAREGGPLDFARRAASGTPPQFPADADVRAEFRTGGHALEGPGHAGEPCVTVTFPCAGNVGGHRVFDYEIRAEAEGAEAVVRRIMAPGFG